MGNRPSLPWIKINDFLLRVCIAASQREFNDLVGTHISDLIPHDFPILCFDAGYNDTDSHSPEDQHRDPHKRIESGYALAGEPETVEAYNRFFRFHLPIEHGYFRAIPFTDFRPFSNTLFVNDFINPRKIDSVLGGWFHSYTIVIPRCKPARPFSDREQAIMRVIAPHLDNFYKALSTPLESAGGTTVQSRLISRSGKLHGTMTSLHANRHPGRNLPEMVEITSLNGEREAAERPRLGNEKVRDAAPSRVAALLTRREREIAELVSLGFSNGGIAGTLFISEETVKRHLHNIFLKVQVKNRVQLVTRFLAEGESDRPFGG